MHGKPTFQKSLRRVQRAEAKIANRSKSYLEIGSWRFQENNDGDLIVFHLESGKTVILVSKEAPEFQLLDVEEGG